MILIAHLGAVGSESGGIRMVTDDLRQIGADEPVEELLYLATDEARSLLFGVSGTGAGLVHAWHFDGLGLSRRGPAVSSGGTEPCHLLADVGAGSIIVANYGAAGLPGSVAVLPVDGDGVLGRAAVFQRSTAPGPDAGRQGESHIHQVAALGDQLLVVDLGADEVVGYLLRDGGLVDAAVSAVPAGSGPRSLVVLDNGRIALTAELASTVLLGRRDGRFLTEWASVPAVAAHRGGSVRNYPSGIALHDKVLYVANRGADCITRFSADDGSVIDDKACGASPRQLVIHDGRLFVAATDADQVQVFELPGLELLDVISVPRPMCVAVLSQG